MSPPVADSPQPMGGLSQTSAQAPASPAQQGQPGQQLNAMPAPSHRQTMAALRHFDAIERELTKLLKMPELGKSDMKSEIIDAATHLVSKGILTPSEAVSELGNVPPRPFDQKKFVEAMFKQTVEGQNFVLDHHRTAFAGQGPFEDGSPNDHLSTMAGLLSHYQGLTKHG